MNKLLQECKNPVYNMYVAPYGFHFNRNGVNLGRIIWRKQNELNGITIEKDEE